MQSYPLRMLRKFLGGNCLFVKCCCVSKKWFSIGVYGLLFRQSTSGRDRAAQTMSSQGGCGRNWEPPRHHHYCLSLYSSVVITCTLRHLHLKVLVAFSICYWSYHTRFYPLVTAVLWLNFPPPIGLLENLETHTLCRLVFEPGKDFWDTKKKKPGEYWNKP